jgi:anti-sigma regulatory factor (Ser/Thr protein kinase)
MEAHEQASANGNAPFPADRIAPGPELIELQAAYRRQARVIDTLTAAVTRLRSGATALKADNIDLRGELDRLRDAHRVWGMDPASELAELAELRLGLDVHAPAVARAVLVSTLRERVPASVLDDAQLVVSELITNSVLHSGTSPETALLIRVGLSSTSLLLEVEDHGRGATIALHPPDLERGGGFGLNIVDTLSEDWGVERTAAGTRVWAQLALATSVTSQPDVDGRITLQATNSDGVNLELDMPSWALEAIRAGEAIAYQPVKATDWSDVVEDDGTPTRRLPLDREEWTQLHHD